MPNIRKVPTNLLVKKSPVIFLQGTKKQKRPYEVLPLSCRNASRARSIRILGRAAHCFPKVDSIARPKVVFCGQYKWVSNVDRYIGRAFHGSELSSRAGSGQGDQTRRVNFCGKIPDSTRAEP